MPELLIDLSKTAAGGAILKCTRADGSITWQRNEKRHGNFFALHDLRHFAVESVLGLSQGFFGLIASGWEIADTTGKGSRGRLPDETIATEHLVGLLDGESASGTAASAGEVNQYAAAYAGQHTRSAPSAISDESLAEIRAAAAALHLEWMNLPPGATMRLSFPPQPNE